MVDNEDTEPNSAPAGDGDGAHDDAEDDDDDDGGTAAAAATRDPNTISTAINEIFGAYLCSVIDCDRCHITSVKVPLLFPLL